MKKLTLALIAGCMYVAVGAYAASGSPADSDKAGRMGPGTAAGQQGATDPSPPSKAPGTTGASSSTRSGTGATSSTTGAGSSSTTGGGMGGERAPRAARG